MNRKLKIFINTVIVQIFVVNTTITAQYNPDFRLYGKVLDAVTLEPISNVHIIKDGHIASVTNLTGEFVMLAELSDSLTFSHIGYEKYSISVEQWKESKKDYIEIQLAEKYTVLPAIEFYNLDRVSEGFREDKEEIPNNFYEYTVPLLQYTARYVSYLKEPFDAGENYLYYQNYPYGVDFARLFHVFVTEERFINEGSTSHFNRYFNDLKSDYPHNPSITISTTFSSGSLK
jgi:hypothetical protein